MMNGEEVFSIHHCLQPHCKNLYALSNKKKIVATDYKQYY